MLCNAGAFARVRARLPAALATDLILSSSQDPRYLKRNGG